MGRLSEYDAFERAWLTGVPESRLPDPVLIVGRAPTELRWEDLSAELQNIYTKLTFVLLAPEE